MRAIIVVIFVLFSCASITRTYICTYAESKRELNVIVKDLKDKKIKYRIIEYPSQHIYEIQYVDTTKFDE